ncbi:hybrid sensor histidine kinase/response regulator [Polaribacter sp. IC073]|uniref:ATP-binding response regulator n=1 Tax=Polaribacter sp. IC073 TaxID=2508540 RepID=UPI0011BE330A|nr:ATP-binding protein [Polaribacter sp. IC073]TXD48277.1 response regulator [Polaribacter sp. IC073]
MIPAKIDDVFIQITTSLSGVILNITAGKFLQKEFNAQESIYKTCPFLEGTLDALEISAPFLLEGMVLVSDFTEYNVDIELFKSAKNISVLIHNRTNVYKYLEQLNQNRNDIFFVKRQLAEKNIELDKLRKIADKANEEKSRFLAMMSHEIRNPLNVILGYAAMISEESINNSVKEYLKLLSLSGEHLKVIVNDILDLSRIEAGKLVLVNSPINIKEISKHCIENYRHQNTNTAVELLLEVSEKVPYLVLGDNVRINQILSNLLSNALKFTEKGEISIVVTVVSEDEKSVNIAFLVSDSGRGMTTAQTFEIFDEYQQNKKTDNRVHGGAGLGLSIVKRLLKAMNGRISVDSELGKGTVFKAEIPFLKETHQKSEVVKKIKTLASKSLRGKRILVADDDALNQTIVAHILTKENVTLTQVKDGLEALDILKTTIFDVVLLDIHMPNITGEQLVQQKKEFKKENRDIPFLALTANTAPEDLKRYKNIGFKSVIGKPYTSVSFLEQIGLTLN